MKYSILNTVLFLCLAANIFADNTIQTNVINRTDSSIQISFSGGHISEAAAHPQSPKKGIAYEIAGISKDALTPGNPDIPIVEKLVYIPTDENITLTILNHKTTLLSNKPVASYQLPLSHSGTYAPPACNQTNYRISTFPSNPVELVSIEHLNGMHIARLHYYPVQYLPLEEKSFHINEVTVNISFQPQRNKQTVNQSPVIAPLRENIIGLPRAYRIADAVPTYLIIGNSQTLTQVSALAQWKTQKGLTVITKDVTEIGNSASAIDSYIESIYDQCDGLLFVLLCGDETIIPSFQMNCPYSNVKAPTDNAYGVVGSGYTPSIYVGRITHGDQNMTAYAYQAWKIIEHESNPEEGEWMQKAMTWGCSQPNGDPTASYWQNQLNSAGITCSKELESKGAKKAAQLVNSFNEGLTTFAMKGHGNDQSWHSAKIGVGYGNASVATMDIGKRFSWVNNIACLNSRFQHSSYTCFAEQMMATGSIDDARGCLGMFSFTVSSSGGSPTQASDGMLSALYKGLFEKDMRHVGVAAAYGIQSSGSQGDKKSSMIWGCPEVDIYFSYPLDTFPTPVETPIPGKTFTVETGFTRSLVSLVTESFDPIVSGYTDEQGAITFTLPSYEAATILTITGRNHKPLIKKYEKVATIGNITQDISKAVMITTLPQKLQLDIPHGKNNNAIVTLYSLQGRQLFQTEILLQQQKQTVILPQHISKGTYIVQVDVHGETFSQQILIP